MGVEGSPYYSQGPSPEANLYYRADVLMVSIGAEASSEVTKVLYRLASSLIRLVSTLLEAPSA